MKEENSNLFHSTSRSVHVLTHWCSLLVVLSHNLARFALDVLAVPSTSDECERLFSRAKLLTARRLVLKIECFRAWYGRSIKGTFNDMDVSVKGEQWKSFGSEEGDERHYPLQLVAKKKMRTVLLIFL